MEFLSERITWENASKPQSRLLKQSNKQDKRFTMKVNTQDKIYTVRVARISSKTRYMTIKLD